MSANRFCIENEQRSELAENASERWSKAYSLMNKHVNQIQKGEPIREDLCKSIEIVNKNAL